MKVFRPERLRPGDRIAVVSPSRTLPSKFPGVANKGMENIRKYFGLEPVVFPHAFDDLSFAYDHPQLRADDINSAFSNQEMKAVISTIGGDESVRILKFLDRNRIMQNPKIFTGFSDCTTVTTYLSVNGMANVYGGAVMAGFAQMDHFPERFRDYWKALLFEDSEGMTMEPFTEYSEGYPDWNTSLDPGAVNRKSPSRPWKWISRESMEGKIFAANIEVLDWLRGTEYFPPVSFFKGKLLFLETSEEIPSPVAVERMLRSLNILGVMDQIAGLAFARFRGYTEEMTVEMERILERMLEKEFINSGSPIVTGLDFGHTDPYFPIPNLIRVKVNGHEIKLLESFASAARS